MYQIWLHGVQWLFGESRFGSWLAAGALSLALPYTWHRFALYMFPKRTLALLSTALISLDPTLIFIYCYFMNETLLLPLLGAALWSTAYFLNAPSRKSAIVNALFWALCMHTKTVAVPMGIISIIFCTLKLRDIRYLAYSVVIIAVISIPQGIRGQRVLNFFYPFASSPFNATYFASGARIFNFNVLRYGEWEFSSPSLYVNQLSPFFDWSTIRYERIRIEINPDNGRADWDREDARIKELHKNFLPAMMAENLIFFLVGHSWPDSNLDTKVGIFLYHSRWIWGPLILLNLFAGIGYLIYRRIDYIPLMTVALILALATQRAGVMEGRYRKPLEPMLILCTVFLFSRRQTAGDRASAEKVPVSPVEKAS